MAPLDVEMLLRLAVKYRARRLVSGGCEVELDASAFASPEPAAEPAPAHCPCPHGPEEHGDVGCLRGCSLDICAGSVGAPS